MYMLYDCKRTEESHDTVITTVTVTIETQVTRETVSVLIVMCDSAQDCGKIVPNSHLF